VAEEQVADKARRLGTSLGELGALKSSLQGASARIVAREREAEELQMRLESTAAAKEAVRRESEWCRQRLLALRAQCEDYALTLRGKEHELHTADLDLERLSREVSAAQSRVAKQLDDTQAIHGALTSAREQVRALKQSQALLLQQAHAASKQAAPLRCELSQLQAGTLPYRCPFTRHVAHIHAMPTNPLFCPHP
jgi:chromosome segregation ATPase